MKSLAQKFLTDKDRKQVRAAVQTAEKNTSGEIVCMVQSDSYHYPVADILAGVTLAMPVALVLTPYLGGMFWLGSQNMWLFITLFAVVFLASHFIVKRLPGLKRRFISQREIDEEVHEAAVGAFYQNKLYRTKRANGVLLFISVFEHRVWILADDGIDAKVGQQTWTDIVTRVTTGINRHHPAEAICTAIREIGEILQAHFPADPDDVNELEDVLVSND
jgi:putative membrane protein